MRTYFDQHVLLGHCRLSIIDLKGGMQPLEYTYQDITYRIIFNGEIYNMNELKKHLIDLGFIFIVKVIVRFYLSVLLLIKKNV